MTADFYNPESDQQPDTVAAVDLGSNSFHMMVARPDPSGLQVIDRLRQSVRLADGLDGRNRLSQEAQDRAIACLEQFGQRLRGIPTNQVRAVGTNTLRIVRKGGEFLSRAEAALGHRIETISGAEEARLIYAGVVQGLGPDPADRLVLDIGGGSTELILGQGDKPVLTESLSMGCVSYTNRFFKGGNITSKRWKRASMEAGRELESLRRAYRKRGWQIALGASGTLRSVAKVLEEMGWCKDGIEAAGLSKLIKYTIKKGNVNNLQFSSLREDRVAIYPGGLLVLSAVFDALKIERMEISDRALRDGILHDLLGRLAGQDPREDSIKALIQRFAVDAEQAHKVHDTCLALFEQAGDWIENRDYAKGLLRWSSQLHETGLAISHSAYHRHSAYLVGNADLAGFTRPEQAEIAALLELQRGRIDQKSLERVPGFRRPQTIRLAILLRLAVLLNRSRDTDAGLQCKLTVDGDELQLSFSHGSLAEHAMTRADLADERKKLRKTGIRLLLKEQH